MKPGTHQGHKDAMRSLKRRLSDTVYRQLLRHTMDTAVDPGGHPGRLCRPARPAETPTLALRTSRSPDPQQPASNRRNAAPDTERRRLFRCNPPNWPQRDHNRRRIGALAYFSEGGSMAWNVKGTYLETCSCEFFCPCNFSFAHGADYDRCRVTFVFNITAGDVEGTDVGGLVVALVADTPKVMTEGNWRVGLFVDDKASDEQADKLAAVFSGALGGPMAGLAPLIGENLGVQRAPIEVREDGLRHSVRIGDAVDFEIEDVVPFGIETGEPVRIVGMFHPAGSEFRVAEARRAKISAFGIEYTGKSALSASQFSWAA